MPYNREREQKALNEYRRHIEDLHGREPTPVSEMCPYTHTVVEGDMRPGFIYFIQSREFVKIGRTQRDLIKKRMAELQTSNPHKLELLQLTMVGDLASAEANIHYHFRKYHHHGEWFKLPAWFPGAIKKTESLDDILHL